MQSKLLRVLETRQVTPLGGLQPSRVSIRPCAATLRSLRAEVAAGRFREDLYFRIGRPELRLPPLSQRREEIPWLVERALAKLAGEARVDAGAEFVEACLLREWPGNVRELLSELTLAAISARAHGRAVLAATDLDHEAGRQIRTSDEQPRPEPESGPKPPVPETATIDDVLRAERGNVARAAARLGLSRSRLRRIIEREGIDLSAFRAGAATQ